MASCKGTRELRFIQIKPQFMMEEGILEWLGKQNWKKGQDYDFFVARMKQINEKTEFTGLG